VVNLERERVKHKEHSKKKTYGSRDITVKLAEKGAAMAMAEKGAAMMKSKTRSMGQAAERPEASHSP
jgi:hypothetical protein